MIKLIECDDIINKKDKQNNLNRQNKQSKTAGRCRKLLLEDTTFINNFLQIQQLVDDIIEESARLEEIKSNDIDAINKANVQIIDLLGEVYGIIDTQASNIL